MALAVSLLGTAAASHAAMYKWIDEDGSVTYSNTPPIDRGKVTEFTKVEDINTIPADKRPKDAQVDPEKRSIDSALAKPDVTPAARVVAPVSSPAVAPRPLILVNPEPASAKPDAAGAKADSPVAKVAPALVRPESARRDAEAARPDAASRAAATAPLQTEAVQDPCLRSADPQCYQRNRDNYHPYLGYAPGTARGVSAPGVGANASPAAGGAVGAHVGSAPPLEKRTPPPGVPTLPIKVQTK